jgi:hypothetical protein
MSIDTTSDPQGLAPTIVMVYSPGWNCALKLFGLVKLPEVTVHPVAGLIDQSAVIKLTQLPPLLKFALVETLVKVNGAFAHPSVPGNTETSAVGALDV